MHSSIHPFIYLCLPRHLLIHYSFPHLSICPIHPFIHHPFTHQSMSVHPSTKHSSTKESIYLFTPQSISAFLYSAFVYLFKYSSIHHSLTHLSIWQSAYWLIHPASIHRPKHLLINRIHSLTQASIYPSIIQSRSLASIFLSSIYLHISSIKPPCIYTAMHLYVHPSIQ